MSAPARAIAVLVGQNPEIRREFNVSETFTQEDIALLAYTLWQRRGCPSGSAEGDWLEAERTLQEPVGGERDAGG
jgi:hypothetical protein